MKSTPLRRCVCGESATFPICDNSHQSENWNCTGGSGEVARWCVVAGPHNLSLAEKLAAELSGVAAHTTSDKVIAERLVVLTEGTDLEQLAVLNLRVEAQQQLVLAMNLAEALIAGEFPQASIRRVAGETALELWDQIRTACGEELPTTSFQPRGLHSAFLSHAVRDEPLVQGPIDYLRRHYAADIFSCADSIRSGTQWQDEIVANLRSRDLFVLLLSKASLTSTFCAFEIGYAAALGKPIAQISLDGTPPPPFAQHLQMNDVQRLLGRKPWLEQGEALLETLLQVLASRIE